ncbi:response regulator transcription factor [Paenibacillus physcomitrellae]|uniref:DNA-binding response regulator n=1 Tax=Paenibacillus physcomitrellae TaxID=1619311 RepID=A0ABQ1G2N8_9BACL|nr:response regulator [Paenibacillus physcomitrellae]GGA35908.1 hypothetical protein GCM10010917_21350 [Paenibacillus physcomitrellae]
MLKVLIVDDEPFNLYGLVSNIDWQELGYEAPVTSESGEEAMELLKETAFDVLISDVSMPGMNGIELVAGARKLYPHLQVLMISGYNEFEFVQDAIHVGAQAYVLKPLKLEEVTGRLKTFQSTLEKMRRVVEQTNELEKKVSGSMRLIKERFVLDLITQGAQETVFSWEGLLDVPELTEGFQLIVFSLDAYLSSGKTAKDRMLIGTGFKQAVEISLNDVEAIYLAHVTPDEYVALHLNPAPQDRVYVEKQLPFVQSLMEEQYGASVTVGCSRTGSSWEEVDLCYREIKFAMAEARLIADGQIVRYEGGNPKEFKDYRLREELMPNLLKLMEQGETSAVAVYLNRVLDVLLLREAASFSYVQAFGMSFLSELIRKLKRQEEPGGETNMVMWRRMLDCGSAEQIIGLITEYVDGYMQVEKKRHHQQHHQQHNLIRRIAAFIEEQLQENWTVKQLAEQFSLNASYLSVLFKREMGKTISEFIQETRIQRARKLLQDPNIKVYEVAEQVGLQTTAYFTYLFKKTVGRTPQEYRDYHYDANDG